MPDPDTLPASSAPPPSDGAAASRAGEADLLVSLEGFDGPIDLLLTLARDQKVDLSRLSILHLAEQYLAYIASARHLRLEIAADYLVMAAWLAYLKSRLLLPGPPEETAPSADMAEALKFQLMRLEAMQSAAAQLLALPQLGHDTFLRGQPEPHPTREATVYYLPVYELLAALGAPLRRKAKDTAYRVLPTRLYSIEDSVRRLRRLFGALPNWGTLMSFLPGLDDHDPLEMKSAIASTFVAALEMAKSGELVVRQDSLFSPIYVRRTAGESQADTPAKEPKT